MKKSVSVIIPAYNHEKYVEKAIGSVLTQTVLPLEIILINDGSTDGTGAICREMSKKHSMIKYTEQANKGAHVTINSGIEMASGKYLAILNSDDCFLPGKIERCLKIVAEHPGTELVSGAVELMDPDGKTLRSGIEADWQKRSLEFFSKSANLPLSILNENFIATTSNMFFTPELWQKNRGFQNLRYCHDLDFLMASFRNAACFYDRGDVHIRYRIHPGNTIKENIRKIWVEIAAVIAVSLVKDNLCPAGEAHKDSVLYFKQFLRNKNLSDLIVFLMMDYIHCADRDIFYNHVTSSSENLQYML